MLHQHSCIKQCNSRYYLIVAVCPAGVSLAGVNNLQSVKRLAAVMRTILGTMTVVKDLYPQLMHAARCMAFLRVCYPVYDSWFLFHISGQSLAVIMFVSS